MVKALALALVAIVLTVAPLLVIRIDPQARIEVGETR